MCICSLKPIIIEYCYDPLHTTYKWKLAIASFCKLRALYQTLCEIMILRRVYSNRVWIERASFHLNYTIKQTFRCAVAFWKSCVCKYSIKFQVTKLKLLWEILKSKKWKILAWYRNKMRRYRQRNPKCVDWHWTNFQVYVT